MTHCLYQFIKLFYLPTLLPRCPVTTGLCSGPSGHTWHVTSSGHVFSKYLQDIIITLIRLLIFLRTLLLHASHKVDTEVAAKNSCITILWIMVKMSIKDSGCSQKGLREEDCPKDF